MGNWAVDKSGCEQLIGCIRLGKRKVGLLGIGNV